MKARTSGLIAMLTLATGTWVLAQEPVVQDRGTTPSTESADPLPKFVRSQRGTNPALRLLEQRVEKVEWTDAPLEEVLNWMKDEADGRVNINPRWRALGVENVTPDSLVSVQLSDVTVAEVLSEVVDQLTEDGEVTFHAWENQVIISTHADFDRTMYLRVYDCTDILFRVQNMGQSAPKIDLQRQNRGGGSGGGGGGGQGVFSGGGGQGGEENLGGQQEEQQNEQQLEKLRERVMQTILPESWDSGQAGAGGRGRIAVFKANLLVYNTIEVHEMIAGTFQLE